MTGLAKALAVQTQEEERARLARLLHDHPAQLLANAVLEIESCLELMDTQPALARTGLEALHQELNAGLAELRTLIAELQPPLLSEMGLWISLDKYLTTFAKQTGIHVERIGWADVTERFPTTMETAIFRIVQEALDNVREHARATRVELRYARNAEQLALTIADNGQGFDRTRGIVPGRRLGFVVMRDRAELLGGTLQVFSEPGKGVRVILNAPLRTAHRSGN